MDLKTVKSYDNSWWLKHLELTTVYDTKLIKEQLDWLIEQAEKVEQLEKTNRKLNHEIEAYSGKVGSIAEKLLLLEKEMLIS